MTRRKIFLLTGLPGSGKSTFSQVAKELGFEVVVMGDIIREEVRKRGFEEKPESFRKVMKLIREEGGANVVAKKTWEKVQKIDNKCIIIDGLRSLEEMNFFKRKDNNVKCVAIIANAEVRYKRILERNAKSGIKRKDTPKNFDEFKKRDELETSLGLKKLIEKCDVIIENNEDDIEEFKMKCKKILEKWDKTCLQKKQESS